MTNFEKLKKENMMTFEEFKYSVSVIKKQNEIDKKFKESTKNFTELIEVNNEPLIDLIYGLLIIAFGINKESDNDETKRLILSNYIVKGCPTHNNDLFNIYQLLTTV